MRFEAGRVVQTSTALGDVRFGGPSGLDQGLDFLVQHFQRSGWQAARHEVGGARTRDRIPLVVASLAGTSPAPVRVVFEAALVGPHGNRESTATDHSGAAFLLELARSWPVTRAERIETICAAMGGPAHGQNSARELLSLIQQSRPECPTLLVIVQGPGIGPELLIGGRRMRPLAEAAARDLWIPHRAVASTPFRGFLFSWPFQDRVEDHVVVLSGEASGEKDVPLDTGALERTAQLCTEIALRWSRQPHQEQGLPDDDRTASRSSQNPG